ncbi:hypothetical protein KEM52_003063 [Ascosphaera acerosa]|nr:hypothetical protein KEM52_003063 [Ascosphaera acerosa]
MAPSRKGKNKRVTQSAPALPPVTGHLRSLAELMDDEAQRDAALSAIDSIPTRKPYATDEPSQLSQPSQPDKPNQPAAASQPSLPVAPVVPIVPIVPILSSQPDEMALPLRDEDVDDVQLQRQLRMETSSPTPRPNREAVHVAQHTPRQPIHDKALRNKGEEDVVLRRDGGVTFTCEKVKASLVAYLRQRDFKTRIITFRAAHQMRKCNNPLDLPGCTSIELPHQVTACIVQAIGVKPMAPCHHCVQGFGPFEECVVLDGGGAGSCANCSWSGGGARCQYNKNRSKLSAR